MAVYLNDNGKCRVAMCTVYPDSAPSDWLYRLHNWHVRAAVSPLHDKDTWDSDKYDLAIDPVTGEAVDGELIHKKGEYKKPHYHVMIAWGNSTTFGVFKRIINDIGGVVPPWDHLEVYDPVAMFRYFAHMDDPDKAQYNIKDSVLFGGFDPYKYETEIEKIKHLGEVLDLLQSHPAIRKYTELIYYLRNNDAVLLNYVAHNTLLFKQVMKDLNDKKDIRVSEL